MKEMKKTIIVLIIVVLLLSCIKKTENYAVEIVAGQSVVIENETDNEQKNIESIAEAAPVTPPVRRGRPIPRYDVDGTEYSDSLDIVPLSILFEEDINFLTEYKWSMSDGRRVIDGKAPVHDWIGNMTPLVTFYKLELPSDITLYQEKLRDVRFTLMYTINQPDGVFNNPNTLYTLNNSFSNDILNITFREDYTTLSTGSRGYFYGFQERVGEQEDPENPLVGIWGKLPLLTEYRIIDPTDCYYYMEIDRKIPFSAIRQGTYLLKQTAENRFETVSSFPDGRFTLTLRGEADFFLNPLFTLPDSEEEPEDSEDSVGPLLLWRSRFSISERKRMEEEGLLW